MLQKYLLGMLTYLKGFLKLSQKNKTTNFCFLHFSKTRLARFLNPRELSDLELNVINLSTIISYRFKKMSITVKMHDILGKTSIYKHCIFWEIG